ncbi:MAG: hypothetical protein GX549_03715 [Clostridiales bacterium]|nr:hypothetical protein [Clostridiales bacterium]
MALADTNSDYTVSFLDGYEEIITALKDGAIDGALLPARYVGELTEDEYTVIAVTAYMSLTAIENGGSITSIYDLDDKPIVIPDSVQSAPEMQMLSVLLSHAGISPDLTFEPEDTVWQRVQDGNFEIMILPAEQCAPVLAYSVKYRSCFKLASQWNALIGAQPPAGGCIIVRSACIEEKRDAIYDFLAALENSIRFLTTHRNKSATAIVLNGLGDDIDYIRGTISHCMFVYLDGEYMDESIRQLSMLTQIQ